MKTCIQEVYCARVGHGAVVLLGNTWKGTNEGNRVGQRKSLSWDRVVVTETSVDPTAGSRTGVALQSCPELQQGDCVFEPTHRPVMRCGLT